MRISLHGGNCCGIKHIHDLGFYPDASLCALKGKKMTSFGQKFMPAANDMLHKNPRGKCDFFNEAAPKEIAKDRFDRFVKFIKNNRSHGIIEVVINSNQKDWKPVLKEQGFEESCHGKNSNTSMTIFVYHLVY